MRIPICIITLLLFGITCNAQIKTYQIDLKDSNLNLLYYGAENKVRIEHLPTAANVVFKRRELTPRDELYFLRCDHEADADSVLQIKVGNREIFKKVFTLKRVGNPIANLGALKDTFATVNEIVAFPYLYIDIPGCALKTRGVFDLYSYSITIIRNNQTLRFQQSSRDRLDGIIFDEPVLTAIKGMKNGDKIIFDDIKVRGSDSIGRALRNLTIYIVNSH